MAVRIALVSAGVVLGVVLGAAAGIHAANEGGASDVADASVLEAPDVEAAPPTPEPGYGIWDRLAACESTGNWHIASGNGYWGGLQFDLPTWRAYGGVGLPSQASRAEQIAIAERLHAARGFAPWPVCSRKLGLR